ncbi:MAG: hypothetical protein ACTHLE_12795 [Agriterribacter sp.]
MRPEDLFRPDYPANSPLRYKLARIYISEKYKEILFVPMGGVVHEGMRKELLDIKKDHWPCDFGNLQKNIEEMLNKYEPINPVHEVAWPAFEASAAKTKKSFDLDYIMLRLESDTKNPYSDGEAERINVRAQPGRLETGYYLIGQEQLIDTELAQLVLDIFNACIKIRS